MVKFCKKKPDPGKSTIEPPVPVPFVIKTRTAGPYPPAMISLYPFLSTSATAIAHAHAFEVVKLPRYTESNVPFAFCTSTYIFFPPASRRTISSLPSLFQSTTVTGPPLLNTGFFNFALAFVKAICAEILPDIVSSKIITAIHLS